MVLPSITAPSRGQLFRANSTMIYSDEAYSYQSRSRGKLLLATLTRRYWKCQSEFMWLTAYIMSIVVLINQVNLIQLQFLWSKQMMPALNDLQRLKLIIDQKFKFISQSIYIQFTQVPQQSINITKPSSMSTKPYEQQQLDRIKKRQLNQLTECPKAFFQLVSFMEANLRKEFKSFSLFNLCQGSTHKLRFNDPAFEKAFSSMMISERIDFYERAVGYGIDAFAKGKKPKQVLDLEIKQQVNTLLPNGHKQIQLTLHESFGSNQHITARIQKFKISSRGHFHINLQNYILRESKKDSHPQTYILQAINRSRPERVRFSFVNAEQERRDYEILRQLSELAFQSTVNSMILSDVAGMSPSKVQRRHSDSRSIGRLVEPMRTGDEQFFPFEEVKETERQNIFGGSEVIEYSRHLAEKKCETRKMNSIQNNNIVDELLLIKTPRSMFQSGNNLDQQNQSQNIFNKVLENQNDIKQPLNHSNPHPKTTKPDKSPMRGFASSEVNQYTYSSSRAVNYKNVFEHMLPEFNLREMDLSVSNKSFNEIYMSIGTMTTILQHISRPQRFQCRVILESLSLQQLYCTLVNQELVKRWNQCVDESQIKITLSAENCLICYEKHKRFSTWFKERDYLFLRHAFTYHQCKYIADRSIEHNSFIPFQSIQRGYLRHLVTRLREVKKGQVELVVDMSVEHGGYLGEEKRKELNLNFLKQYQNLQFFISQQRATLTMMPAYCNTEWSIDWIDQANGGLYPQSLTLKTEDFLEGSEIDEIGIDNVQLQSEDFYSIQDQDERAQPQAQSPNNFQFQTTQGFEQLKPVKNFSQGGLVQENQLSENDQLESDYGNMSTVDQQIVLNDEGYCVLPQKYFKKRHPILPQKNYVEEKHKVYDNIIMKGDFVQSKDGGILLVNKPKIQAQDNVINFIMKTMRKNLLSGKSILSISLPVEIFKNDSNTQRLCESMTMGPHFLEKASKNTDPLQRMKLSICFGLSNSLMYFDIEKTFNPILGQTYQGMIDGCPIYAEQISHHPPITSLYFVGRGFRVYASVEAKVFLHLNSGDGVNQGFYSVEFDDGHIIRFQTAPGELSGFTIGDRKYKFKDKMYVYDKKHSYFSTLNFEDPNAGFFSKSKWQHPDQMQGSILKVSPSFILKFQKSEQKLLPKPKQIESTLSTMSGRWIHYLNFDGIEYYNIDNEVPFKLVNYEHALNSDARYREDLIYRVRNDLAKSQIYKENLENKQRKDRKLREQYSGKKH